MSKYFKLEEFLTSSIARQKSIENMPSWDVVEHLNELALFLDQLRKDWGSGINVTSGFRNQKLNDAVGGAKASAHKSGYAADLQPSKKPMSEFKAFVQKWVQDKDFDQCIIEKNTKGAEWIHLALYGEGKKQRHEVFKLSV